MQYFKDKLLKATIESLKYFIQNDRELIDLGANERAATHRIAHYLQNIFPNFDVDCEYNRDGHKKKEINGKKKIPDIVVHIRNSHFNFLVIQAKKEKEYDEDDIKSLIDFTKTKGKYHYLYGIYLVFKKDDVKIECSIYENGENIKSKFTIDKNLKVTFENFENSWQQIINQINLSYQ